MGGRTLAMFLTLACLCAAAGPARGITFEGSLSALTDEELAARAEELLAPLDLPPDMPVPLSLGDVRDEASMVAARERLERFKDTFYRKSRSELEAAGVDETTDGSPSLLSILPDLITEKTSTLGRLREQPEPADEPEPQPRPLSPEELASMQNPPQMCYTSEDLGDGLWGHTFFISCSDGLELSYAVTAAFWGADGASVRQRYTLTGQPIDSEALANRTAGLDRSYDKRLDSWVFSPFAENALPGVNPLDYSVFDGCVEADNLYLISGGTGPDSHYGDGVPVAYIVADGAVEWAGTIARVNLEHAIATTSGITPEPAAMALLLIGAAGLSCRKQSRR